MSLNLLSLLLLHPIRSSRISGPPGTSPTCAVTRPSPRCHHDGQVRGALPHLVFLRPTREIVVERTGLLCWPLLSRRWFLKQLCGLIGFLNIFNPLGLQNGPKRRRRPSRIVALMQCPRTPLPPTRRPCPCSRWGPCPDHRLFAPRAVPVASGLLHLLAVHGPHLVAVLSLQSISFPLQLFVVRSRRSAMLHARRVRCE